MGDIGEVKVLEAYLTGIRKKSHSKLEKLSICSLQSGLKEEVGHEVVCEKPLPLRGYCLWGFKGKVAGLLLVVKRKRWRS